MIDINKKVNTDKIGKYKKLIEQVDTQIKDAVDKIKQDKDYIARSFLTDMYHKMI
jgi:hypothetical protein